MRRTSVSGPERDAEPDHRQAAFRIVGIQTVVATVLAAVLLAWQGIDAATSALAGGVTCVVANAGFAARSFRVDPRSDPKRLLRAFYAGEVLKIGLTVALFAVAIVVVEVDVLIMILAYLATTAVFWFALVANDGRQLNK